MLSVGHYLGGLLGAAHRRGAERPPGRAWTASERGRLIDDAFALSGTYEAMFLIYGKLAGKKR